MGINCWMIVDSGWFIGKNILVYLCGIKVFIYGWNKLIILELID